MILFNRYEKSTRLNTDQMQKGDKIAVLTQQNFGCNSAIVYGFCYGTITDLSPKKQSVTVQFENGKYEHFKKSKYFGFPFYVINEEVEKCNKLYNKACKIARLLTQIKQIYDYDIEKADEIIEALEQLSRCEKQGENK